MAAAERNERDGLKAVLAEFQRELYGPRLRRHSDKNS
jgi:hypothetical protein